MKGAYVVLIMILLIILVGIFTWLWVQDFNQNQESIATLFYSLV